MGGVSCVKKSLLLEFTFCQNSKPTHNNGIRKIPLLKQVSNVKVARLNCAHKTRHCSSKTKRKGSPRAGDDVSYEGRYSGVKRSLLVYEEAGEGLVKE